MVPTYCPLILYIPHLQPRLWFAVIHYIFIICSILLQLVVVLNGYYDLCNGDSNHRKQAHPTVTLFRNRAARYLASLDQVWCGILFELSIFL